MQIKPTFHRIVVKPYSPSEIIRVELKSRGVDLHIPQPTEKPSRGRVVALGPGRILPNGATCAIQLHKGDDVIFNQYAGVEVSLDGEKFLVISEDEIICRLVPDPPKVVTETAPNPTPKHEPSQPEKLHVVSTSQSNDQLH